MERRTRTGILLAVAALCLTGAVAFILGGRTEHHRTAFPVMGTVAGMTFYTGPEEFAGAVEAVKKEFDLVSRTATVHDGTSELSRLNAAAAEKPFACSPEMWELLTESRRAYRLSEGAFDISVKPLMDLWGFYRKRSKIPSGKEIAEAKALTGLDKVVFDDIRHTVKFSRPGMALDLGGIAKGYALERAARAVIALGIGRMPIAPSEVLDVLRANLSGGHAANELAEKTIMQLRLPRIILAALVGAGLSVSGCAFQSLFANPLATPDTLGVASGAAFGAALGILLGFNLIGIQVLGLAMGGAAVALTWLAGSGRDRGGLSYIVLSGIMIGSLFSALISFIKFAADAESQLPAITYWLMGSLGSAGYKNLAMGAPIIIISIVIIFLLRWRMNLLSLSEDELIASGTNVKMLRTLVVICAAAMTSSVISMCGQVGWVGLIVPHMCRMIWGQDNKKLIPASISIGAAFMVIVDTVARSVSAAEIPVSILTAIIGAPFFIFILTYRKRLITT